MTADLRVHLDGFSPPLKLTEKARQQLQFRQELQRVCSAIFISLFGRADECVCVERGRVSMT